MKVGVRGKLFAASLLFMLAVGLASGVYLERSLKTWLEARIESDLLHHAHTAQALLEIAAPRSRIPLLDPIADRLGRSTDARVTVVAPDGRVLGDSELDQTQLVQLENHGARPEVRSALAQGSGSSRRYSTTLRTDMLYVAVPYEGDEGRGIVRVALPLSEVELAVSRLRLVLALAGLVGLVAALLLSVLASHLASRAIRQLAARTRAAVAGERGRTLVTGGADGLLGLPRSFGRLVEELDHTVTALADERDHLDTILEGLREGVLALDAGNHVTRINRVGLELLGLSSFEAGKTLIEVARVPALIELVSGQSGAGDGTAEFELPGGRRVLARAAQMKTAGGCVLVMHDVTETRRLETVRRDFVANVSHELRTPVSVIRANAETLLGGALEDPKRSHEFVDAMHRNAERLGRIIADLLDLARIEAGELALEPRPVSLLPAVQHMVQSVAPSVPDTGPSFHVELDPELQVLADAQAVEQVLINLLANAIKFAPGDGHITVRALEEHAVVRIEVEDDGPGIEPPHRERIFERFYRVDPSRSREAGGTGLGLAIARHLVGAMGGSIGMRPAAQRGSVFWFTLPRA